MLLIFASLPPRALPSSLPPRTSRLSSAFPLQDTAEQFYIGGLGLTRDPAKGFGGTIWANIGSQQFHLVLAKAGETPQQIRGTIGQSVNVCTGPLHLLPAECAHGDCLLRSLHADVRRVQHSTGLALPDLPALLRRLKAVAPALAGTKFAFNETMVVKVKPPLPPGSPAWMAVEVCCPWGNRFIVHALEQPVSLPPMEAGASKMEETHHAAAANFGVRGGPGIRYVELLVNAGCSERAAKFYEGYFGCTNATGWVYPAGVSEPSFVESGM